MTILIEPDRTTYPPALNAEIIPGIEQLTGADLIISDCPLPFMEATLQDYIDSGSLFVQIKIGYDILSFDALHNFCARIQRAQIPKQQAILLRIGEYWEDENGLFRIKGSRPYGQTTWQQYRRMLMSNMLRGITIYPECLSSVDELPQWIEDYQSVIEKIRSEGKRELYPQYLPPQFEVDDIWQLVEEVDPNTWEHLLCAGLKGFGQKTVQNIREYFDNELLRPPSGLTVLETLTDEDERGKAIHNIKSWGDTKRKILRDILFLPPGFNLRAKEIMSNGDNFHHGWYGALRSLKEMIEEGHSVKNAFNGLMLQANEFFRVEE